MGSERTIYILMFVGLLGLPDTASAWTRTAEESLRTSLFTNYVSAVRPSDTTNVGFMLAPLSLNKLDISQQLMSTTMIYIMSWTDDRLQWTPASHGNVTNIIIPPANIWVPEVIIENAVSGIGVIGGKNNDGTSARVFYTGAVLWVPPSEVATSCDMRIARYPYDKQTCTVTVTSWGLTDTMVDLQASPPYMEYYEENGEWELMGTRTSLGTFSNEAGEHFSRNSFHFTFRRRWQFYGLNLLMPIVLTSLMICFVFYLPFDSGEKMGYSLTVLLSYTVFLTWVTDMLPSTSVDVSCLQLYLAVVLVCATLATLLTTWTLTMYHRGPDVPMSPRMRHVVTRILVPLGNCACRKRNNAKVGYLPNGHADPKEQKLKEALPAHAPEEEVKQPEATYTWQEVAQMWDNLFFVMFITIKPILAVVVIFILYTDYLES